MKFVIAMMEHETNTFSPLSTPHSAFAGPTGRDTPPTGDDAIAAWGRAGMPFSAFIDAARAEGAEIDVPLAAYAEPSGLVDAQAFDEMADRICDAVAKGCDAVMLDLHGAMVVENNDDGEGELLRRIRHVNPDVPIAVALDFHANMTSAMIDNASVITGYLTYPHVDMYETGERAAKTLLRMMRGEVEPQVLWQPVPILSHMLRQAPTSEPMRSIMDLAIEAETSGAVLNASIFGGFPLADIPHVSIAPVIVADKRKGSAEDLLSRLTEMTWAGRAGFEYMIEPIRSAIDRAIGFSDGPIVLADHGDNCGAGGAVDDMTVLRECLARGMTDMMVGPIWDPQAVEIMSRAGIGAEVTLPIGGKHACEAIGQTAQPLMLTGKVVAVTDGRFKIEGPMMTGLDVDLRGTAMLDIGSALIVVSGDRCEPYDLTYLSHLGVNPADMRYLLIKSRKHFRAAFGPIAREIVMVAGRGPCTSDYDSLPFQNLTRPIFPLDRRMAWGRNDD